MKKNNHLHNLDDLDLDSISSDASLSEKKENNTPINEIKKLELRLPKKFHSAIKDGIASYKITGSMNAYIVESVRRKLIEDDLL